MHRVISGKNKRHKANTLMITANQSKIEEPHKIFEKLIHIQDKNRYIKFLRSECEIEYVLLAVSRPLISVIF